MTKPANQYTIRCVRVSSGFCTVEHYHVRSGGKDLNSYWSREEALRDIAIRKRVDAQCLLLRKGRVSELDD